MIIDDSKKPSQDGKPSDPKDQVKAVEVEEDPQKVLARIMLQREARLALKEQQEEQAKINRDKQRDINARSHYNDSLVKQTNCKHLKGGRHRLRTQAKDFAVYIHTFINAEQVIRCFLCGMKWKRNDTRESLYRDGKQVANHTKLGWDDATQMINETSNQPSSSEIPMNATPVVQS